MLFFLVCPVKTIKSNNNEKWLKWKFYLSLTPCHHKLHTLPWGLCLTKGFEGEAGEFPESFPHTQHYT